MVTSKIIDWKNVEWSELLTEFKYCPADLAYVIDHSPNVAALVSQALDSAAKSCTSLHPALRAWKTLLLGLLGFEISDIANPYLRTEAYTALNKVAQAWSVPEASLRIAISEIPSLYNLIKDRPLYITIIDE